MLRKWTLKNLLPAAEVSDDIVDLLTGPLQHFRYGALAEVQAVVGTLVHRHELLQPFDRPHYAGNTAIFVVLNAGVLGVACHLDLVFRCHRHDALKEVVDSLPHGFSVGGASFELGQRLVEVLVFERRQLSASPTVTRAGPQVAENCDVVEQAAQARLGRYAYDLAQTVQLPLPFRRWEQERCGTCRC